MIFVKISNISLYNHFEAKSLLSRKLRHQKATKLNVKSKIGML